MSKLPKIEERKINELIAAAYNPRTLSKEESQDIRASLMEFGFQGVVIVNQYPKRKDIIVGGHQRLRIWRELGNRTVPCMYVNLPLIEEKKLNLRLNKAQGHWDYEKLEGEFDRSLLEDVGFDAALLDELMEESRDALSDNEDEDEEEPVERPRKKRESTSPAPAQQETVLIKVGEIETHVPRRVFEDWREEFYATMKKRKTTASEHLRHMLGMEHEDEG